MITCYYGGFLSLGGTPVLIQSSMNWMTMLVLKPMVTWRFPIFRNPPFLVHRSDRHFLILDALYRMVPQSYVSWFINPIKTRLLYHVIFAINIYKPQISATAIHISFLNARTRKRQRFRGPHQLCVFQPSSGIPNWNVLQIPQFIVDECPQFVGFIKWKMMEHVPTFRHSEKKIV